MMQKVAIYLAGSIQKGDGKLGETYWSDEHMRLLKELLPNYEVSFLNPAFRTDDMSDPESVFGRDMTQVYCSDFVFIDARDKRGLGVGAEMMYAKLNRIPVLSWAPKNSHYHKSKTTVLGVPVEEFIHPFVFALSDAIVETLEEGASWIDQFLSTPVAHAKGIECISAAMERYKETQLPQDTPMLDLLNADDRLKERVYL